ncbi:hypothetical protein AUP68_14014 [Ilyonectria robusta]
MYEPNRRLEVVRRLRAEILEKVSASGQPTYTQLNVRVALRDTTLLRGGGTRESESCSAKGNDQWFSQAGRSISVWDHDSADTLRWTALEAFDNGYVQWLRLKEGWRNTEHSRVLSPVPSLASFALMRDAFSHPGTKGDLRQKGARELFPTFLVSFVCVVHMCRSHVRRSSPSPPFATGIIAVHSTNGNYDKGEIRRTRMLCTLDTNKGSDASRGMNKDSG